MKRDIKCGDKKRQELRRGRGTKKGKRDKEIYYTKKETKVTNIQEQT